MKRVRIQRWEGCYDKQLKGFIVPEAFSHPAKYSLGLIERIFDYCLERGYLKRGDVVGDCFGGVAIGGLVAAYRGLRWVGVELELKFVGLAQQNIKLHLARLEAFNRPWPRIIQGDSRKFHEHVQAAGIVSSPPYAESVHDGNGIDESKLTGNPAGKNSQAFAEGYGQTPGQIGRLKAGEVAGVISSPPFTQTPGGAKGINVEGYNGRSDIKPDFLGNRTYQGQGGDRTEGNIETLKPGDIQAVISSPPCSDIAAGAGGLNTKPASKLGQQSGRKAESASQDTDQRYGKASGQISQLKGGSVEAVVSSPPWENNSEGVMKASKFKDPAAFAEQARKTGHGASLKAKLKAMAADESRDNYGDSPGQIGKLKGGDIDGSVSSPPYGGEVIHARPSKMAVDLHQGRQCKTGLGEYGESEGQIQGSNKETYWQAMAQVYASCHLAIKPGGYIVLVVKDYVKAGKRVPLCDDTCRLLEHCGFTVIERIHAMLVKETTHGDLFNGHTVQTKSRKSFFRRLAEKKGSPRIDYEEVLIARRH